MSSYKRAGFEARQVVKSDVYMEDARANQQRDAGGIDIVPDRD